MTGLPTRTPADLEDRPRHQHSLVDTLWARDAVGIIGGEPKCGKSFLALDLAVAVAAGVPCLRHFPAAQTGPVVLFAAEDASHIVRTRLEGIARAADTPFERLDIAVIDVPALRLDHRADRQRLHDTVEHIRPRLLVLDPLVRLHSVDENAVAEIAPRLCIGVRKPKRTHHALQLDADECEWDDQKRAWHICHDGRMSQVPRETVMEAVREAQAGSWIDTNDKGRERISLGTLPDADSATWRNSRNLLANLIHYAIIRTNLREARSR